MATLEKIRKKAGLLVTVVGIALFAFIIGDLLNSGSSFLNRNQNSVVVVNGNTVDYQDYMARENELTEVYQIMTGTSSLNENYTNQVRQAVYEDIIMENVLEPRLEKVGMYITPEEMTDMVEGENISPVLLQLQLPIFQNPQTGAFDRNAVINFLNQIKNIDDFPEATQAQLMPYKTMWMFWEKNIKRNRMTEKYMTMLNKAIVANSLDAKDAFNNSAESSDITYVMESFSSIADSTVDVPASEIEKLYKERKEMFRQSETCVIDYIAIDIAPSQDDYNRVAKEMDAIKTELETTENVAALTNEKSERKYMNAFISVNGFGTDQDAIDFVTTAEIGDIEGPVFKDNKYRILKLMDKTEAADSVNVSEMMLAQRATEAETKAYADSLLNEIKNGADFAEIVKTHSIDQWAENNGEIGWLTEAAALQGLNEEFKKTVFSLPVGQSAVVKSTYGYLVVKVTDKTKNVPKYKIADIEYTVTPSSATRSLLYNALNQFIANNNSADKIEAAAKDNGYNLVSNVRVYSTDMSVGGSLTGARQVVRWAFNNKRGQISDINECDDKFVVAVHKGKLPEGYQSLASVTPQLKAELAAKKKGAEIAAALKAKNLSSIAAYADAMSAMPDTVKFITMATTRITNIGVEPKLNALISMSPLNKVSEPVAGNNGVYVFEVINRTSDNGTYDESRQKSMIEANNSYRIESSVMRYMQQKANIEDHRIRFY
ncbi:MAG: SurA N-terminal domain-containing protein [Tannerella sp.]|jgi:peptidyl-prolyl cis-trans isomerase D|nr:SurA N-terminal domain-containing protein [Tannerella sp.]